MLVLACSKNYYSIIIIIIIRLVIFQELLLSSDILRKHDRDFVMYSVITSSNYLDLVVYIIATYM